MSRLVRLASLALAVLLTAFLVGSPAQASPRSPDPEVVQHAAPASTRSTARAIPAAVDSDVYVSASTATGHAYFVVAGHLTLRLRSGSATAYQGSLVDYVGNKAYRASADATDAGAPMLKLEGKNGKFTFRLDAGFGGSVYTGTATSKPSKLKVPLSTIFFVGSAHSVRTASYDIVLTERSGSINNPVEYAGTLTMAYDANNRISGGQVTVTSSKGKTVTHALKSSGFWSSGYFYTLAQVDKKYFGLSATTTGTIISGFAFAADGSRTTQWVLSGNV